MIRILQNITYTKHNKQSKISQEYNIKINRINTPNYLTLKHPIKNIFYLEIKKLRKIFNIGQHSKPTQQEMTTGKDNFVKI